MTSRRFHSRNSLRFILIAAIAACFCLGSPSHAAERIRIAVSNPNMPNLTAQMALKRGFFKDENLDAEIIRMNPNVAITALATGDVDYCQLFGAVVGGAVSGLPVRIVAGFLDNWPMTLIAQPEIKTLKDLKGKTLGISSFGATPDVAARMMIKQAGIDSDKEIKILALGSDAARMTALMQRIVDVVVMSPPPTPSWKNKAIKSWPAPTSYSIFPTSVSAPICAKLRRSRRRYAAPSKRR